jgi:hypothetical protein
MYSFAQREDTSVYDEPLYGYYLNNTKADEYHPSAKEILGSMEQDGNKVVNMMMGKHDTEVVFFKNMTHHLLDLDRSFMKDTTNIILTRDPVEMLPSFAKVIDNPTIEDVGYALHIDLLNYLNELGNEPIVIDSKSILLNPEKMLTKLCNLSKIPFDNCMLNWKKGPRSEDGIWAKHWYRNIHLSNSFSKYQPKGEPFPNHLIPLLKNCLPHYERLKKISLQ